MNLQRSMMLIAVLSMGCALYFVNAWQSRRADLDSEDYSVGLRSLLALDFRLTGEVMKARSGLVSHYDSLVQTLQEISALHRRLRVMPHHLARPQREELTRRLAVSEEVDARAAAAVERWKSANAVLRNSLRFLPFAALAVDAYGTRDSAHAALRQRVDTLVRDLLLIQSVDDRVLQDRITSTLGELVSTDASMLAAGVGKELSVLLLHSRIVRERTPIVNSLTREIVHMPLAESTASAMSAYAGYRRAASDAAGTAADFIFLFAMIGVLSGAAAIIVRMRGSARELRITSAELERAVASLRVEQAKERELGELKSRFVSMTSHEFRTPLSTIMSSSEMLAAYGGKWPPEKTATHFARIRDAVLNMTGMLDSILLIGRSDAGMLEFAPRPLDLGRLCGEAVEAVDTGQTPRCVVDSALAPGEMVVGDENLLRHVLSNLLSNALKYSPIEQPVYLRVRREHDDVCFEIEDCGIGIPAEDQKHLFETFHRGRNVGAVAGSGLGLAIVKRAVELHGGTLQLDTKLRAGSKFTARVYCPEHAA